MGNYEFLISVAAQVPIVAIFVWFTLQLRSQFDKSLEKRDVQWQAVMLDIQKRSIDATAQVTTTMKELVTCVSQQGDIIKEHDKETSIAETKIVGLLGDIVRRLPKKFVET